MKDELASVRQAIDWTVKNCPNAPYVPVKREVLESLEAKLEKAREVLKALAFSEFEKDEGLADTQYVWETIYNDRAQDWFGYEEIEAARNALKELSQ